MLLHTMHFVEQTRPVHEVQAMPSEAADGGYVMFNGLHKSCSKCKQARNFLSCCAQRSLHVFAAHWFL